MRRTLQYALTLLVAATAAIASAAAPIEIRATVSKPHVLVGEPIDLTLTIKAADGVRIDPFSPPSDLKGFELLSATESKPQPADGGGAVHEIRIRLSAFDVGDTRTPEFEIGFSAPSGEAGVAKAPPADVRVVSYVEQLKKDGGEVALRDIKPPVRWPFAWGPLWIAAGAAAALLALGLLAWRLMRRMRRATAGEPPPPPLLEPADEALQALAEVEMQDLARRETAKNYYSRLSDILRRYLGRRYRFDAMEMTSSELLDWASTRGWQEDLYRLLTDDLSEADYVKFARYSPTLAQRQAALERPRTLVLRTRPPRQTQTAPETESDHAHV